MSLKLFVMIMKALCVSLCLASSSSTSEDVARDLIDHVLRIRDPEKVLNSVLGRLERNRQQGLIRPSNDAADCEEPSEIIPEYTESLQASRERDLRQLGPQVRNAAHKIIHYPICHLERKIRKLNTNEYEYQPAYYEEVRCTMASSEDIGVTNEICSSLGFSCVQWNKTIHLTRRRYTSDCWETRTMVIPAGCECMWPVHRLGDMNLHV